jgi:hypothetical protein
LPWPWRSARSGGWEFRQLSKTFDRVDLEEVSLAGSFDQPFPPRTKDVAAVELQLLA